MKYINNERNVEFISVLEDKDNASIFRHFKNKKYKIIIKVIVPKRDGTINEFTSIRPSVSLSKNVVAIAIIINEPIIFGIPKN